MQDLSVFKRFFLIGLAYCAMQTLAACPQNSMTKCMQTTLHLVLYELDFQAQSQEINRIGAQEVLEYY